MSHQVTAIIFIASRISHGHYPKAATGFKHSAEHGLYIYDGRELSIEEFNRLAPVVMDPKDRIYSISARIFEREVEDAAESEEALAPEDDSIKVGETVWFVGGSPPLLVTALNEHGDADLEYETPVGKATAFYNVSALTREERPYEPPVNAESQPPAAEEKPQPSGLEALLAPADETSPPVPELELSAPATTPKPTRGGKSAQSK